MKTTGESNMLTVFRSANASFCSLKLLKCTICSDTYTPELKQLVDEMIDRLIF